MRAEEAPVISQLSEVHEPAEILEGLALKKLIQGGGTDEDSMGNGESEGADSPGSVRTGAPAGAVYWCDDGWSDGGSAASNCEADDADTVMWTVFSTVLVSLVAVIV